MTVFFSWTVTRTLPTAKTPQTMQWICALDLLTAWPVWRQTCCCIQLQEFTTCPWWSTHCQWELRQTGSTMMRYIVHVLTVSIEIKQNDLTNFFPISHTYYTVGLHVWSLCLLFGNLNKISKHKANFASKLKAHQAPAVFRIFACPGHTIMTG